MLLSMSGYKDGAAVNVEREGRPVSRRGGPLAATSTTRKANLQREKVSGVSVVTSPLVMESTLSCEVSSVSEIRNASEGWGIEML